MVRLEIWMTKPKLSPTGREVDAANCPPSGTARRQKENIRARHARALALTVRVQPPIPVPIRPAEGCLGRPLVIQGGRLGGGGREGKRGKVRRKKMPAPVTASGKKQRAPAMRHRKRKMSGMNIHNAIQHESASECTRMRARTETQVTSTSNTRGTKRIERRKSGACVCAYLSLPHFEARKNNNGSKGRLKSERKNQAKLRFRNQLCLFFFCFLIFSLFFFVFLFFFLFFFFDRGGQ